MIRLRTSIALWSLHHRVLAVTSRGQGWQDVTLVPWCLQARPYDVRVELS